ACTGANPVTCQALDQCHGVGVCNPLNGMCSNPPKTGAGCDDGNDCTQTDTCSAQGVCTGSNPVVCPAADQCHQTRVCDPGTGQCPNTPKGNGAQCDDGNECTQTDTCQGGSCTGSNPVQCNATDQCHDPGVCDSNNGTCSNPKKDNDTPCNDGDICTD